MCRRPEQKRSTRTVPWIAGAVLVLCVYFGTEYLLRKQMFAPVKKEKVDIAKLVDWMPQSTKKELQYRAKYLELQQAHTAARTKEDILNTAYALAVHTRDQAEHNQLLLPFIKNSEYRDTPGLYLIYGRFLADSKNPKSLSVEQYLEFLSTLSSPEEYFLAWRGGRDALNRHRASRANYLKYLRPLLAVNFKNNEIRDYFTLFGDLERYLKWEIAAVNKRIKADSAFPGDDALLKKLEQEKAAAVEWKNSLNKNPETYNLYDYRRLLKLRANYRLVCEGKAENGTLLPVSLRKEAEMKAARALMGYLRNFKERDQLARKYINDPAFKNYPGIYTAYAVLLYDKRNPNPISIGEYIAFIQGNPDRLERFYAWRDGRDRLNRLRVSPFVLEEFYRPLFEAPPEQLEIRDYVWLIRDLANAVKRELDSQKKKKTFSPEMLAKYEALFKKATDKWQSIEQANLPRTVRELEDLRKQQTPSGKK